MMDEEEHNEDSAIGYVPNIRVLMYHRVVRDGAGNGCPDSGLPERQFRQQLRSLERWGSTPITFSDYAFIKRGELAPPRKPIILTFDDGYLDTYEVAYPILLEFGMRAVVFVLADEGQREAAWDGENGGGGAPLMDVEQILELHQASFEIGSHSLTHPYLPLLPREKAWEEISRSRQLLEILLNAPVSTFAYPFGGLNQTLKAMVADAGYQYACSVWSGPMAMQADPLEIRRINVEGKSGPAGFVFQVMGPALQTRSIVSKVRTVIGRRENPKHVSQARCILMAATGLDLPAPEEQTGGNARWYHRLPQPV